MYMRFTAPSPSRWSSVIRITATLFPDGSTGLRATQQGVHGESEKLRPCGRLFGTGTILGYGMVPEIIANPTFSNIQTPGTCLGCTAGRLVLQQGIRDFGKEGLRRMQPSPREEEQERLAEVLEQVERRL